MFKKLVLPGLAAALALSLLSACSGDKQPVSTSEPETLPEPTLAARQDMLEKYQDILEGIYYDNLLPDGQPVAPRSVGDPEYPNQFAVCDIDGDGAEELIVRYINTYTAGRFGVVYGYGAESGQLTTQLYEYTALNFYENGVVEVGWSHNQGLGGRFWPCTFYQYDPNTDTYVLLATADAWDREFHETDYNGNPFPDEIDTDGENIVFYVRPAGTEGSVAPISYTDFYRWYNDTIGFDPKRHTYLDFPVEVPYQALTGENIAAIL